MTLEVVYNARDDLGEVPIWCDRSRRLFWTNIRDSKIHALSLETQTLETFEMPDWAGAFALCQSGNLIVACRKSILSYDIQSRSFLVLGQLESNLATNRTNDGRCDRQGRMWLGTLNNSDRVPTGSLYCVGRAGNSVHVERHIDGIIVPNALSWSPDGRTMYFADSWIGDIWAFDFDCDDGSLSNRRVFLAKDALPGIPDGATVDADGCLWHTRYGAGQIVRVTPGGVIDRVIQSDTMQLTACTLGGSDLRDLFVTSACQRMNDDELAAQPDAGSVFAARVETPGLPEPRFADRGADRAHGNPQGAISNAV